MIAPPLLLEISTRLAAVSETPALDASVLLAHITKRGRTWVIAHPELSLCSQEREELEEALQRLENGEPLPYVLGHWEFFGIEFDITPDVLIPRPETELLVERALDWLSETPESKRIVDVGTGSGVIAISLAARLPDLQILATDISLKALEVARRNAQKYEVAKRIDFVQCDLLPGRAVPGVNAFDLICANLPYIPTNTLSNLPVFGREPTLALDGGEDGLDLVRHLLDIGPQWLAADGMMLLELEATNAIRARDLACTVFPKGAIHLHHDLAGHPRLLEIHP